MVSLNIAMQQEQAKAVVLALDENIRFVKKEGLGLFFETPNDIEYAVKIKAALKADPNFKALYFNVDVK